jgi:putative transposase
MPYDPNIHHRRSIRAHNYDYTEAGAYFLTLCTHQKQCLFGEIIEAEMKLNRFGDFVYRNWLSTEFIRDEVILDHFVVMPNHFHAIVFFVQLDTVKLNNKTADIEKPTSSNGETKLRRSAKSLGSLVAGFKATTTAEINTLRNSRGVPVWQRNYYDHVSRNEKDLERIREYIRNNPARWEYDRENPNRTA